jgi:cytochrome P450
VGMSGIFVHNSESIFKNFSSFIPDRWLAPNAASLERWLVAFSKGPRMCMGQKYVYTPSSAGSGRFFLIHDSLAYCELYLAFASLFRRFDLTLDGTR